MIDLFFVFLLYLFGIDDQYNNLLNRLRMSRVHDILETSQYVSMKTEHILHKHKYLPDQIVQIIKVKIKNLKYDFIKPFQYQPTQKRQVAQFRLLATHAQIFLINMSVKLTFGEVCSISLKCWIKSTSFAVQNFKIYSIIIDKVLKPLNCSYRAENQEILFLDRTVDFKLETNKINPKLLADNILRRIEVAFYLCEEINFKMRQPIQNNISLENNPTNVYRQIKNNPISKDFTGFYQIEAAKRTFIIDPLSVKIKSHSVLRTIAFQNILHYKQLFSDVEQTQRCGFSTLSLLWVNARVFNTIIRANFMGLDYLEDYENGSGHIILVRKMPNFKDGAESALKNQIAYMRNNGHIPCPYICNTYLRLNDGQANSQNQSSQEIYLEYHQISATDYFFDDRYSYSMLDIINFGLQMMRGLITFFLTQGYINRDVKQSNTMISRDGIVQMIDPASSYPISFPDSNSIVEQNIRNQFDRTLRSTYFINSKRFLRYNSLIDKWFQYGLYKKYSSVHKNFDVFSVGIMLTLIKNQYDSRTGVNCPEFDERWNRLVGKMKDTQPDGRLTMEQAYQKLFSIKSQFFNYNQKL